MGPMTSLGQSGWESRQGSTSTVAAGGSGVETEVTVSRTEDLKRVPEPRGASSLKVLIVWGPRERVRTRPDRSPSPRAV